MTVEIFFATLQKSKLLAPEQFASARGEVVRMGSGVAAENVAARLVERGYLTQWQANELLGGFTGFIVGNYKLIDHIGQGGMGAVFKAEHAVMGRMVALKVLSKARLDNPTAVQRFKREVKAAAALDHPNIITAHDAGQIGDMHFLVMEYVDGRDLNAWAKNYGLLPFDWASEFIRQAALGLEHAQQQGMVHRDIKPANLLVLWEPNSAPVVKILDMGLARFTQETSDGDSGITEHSEPVSEAAGNSTEGGLTQAGQILGTPDYLSPEQIEGTRNVDIRADIFSLGCTMFRLLTGQLPFGGATVIEKLNARTSRSAPPPPLLRTLRPDAPPVLEQILAKMLARDPDQRFQTPGEVSLALAPFSLLTASNVANVPVFASGGYVDPGHVDPGYGGGLSPMLPPQAFMPGSVHELTDSVTRDFLNHLGNAAEDANGPVMTTLLPPSAPPLWPPPAPSSTPRSLPHMTPLTQTPANLVASGPAAASPAAANQSRSLDLPNSPRRKRAKPNSPMAAMIVAGIATLIVGGGLIYTVVALAQRDDRARVRNVTEPVSPTVGPSKVPPKVVGPDGSEIPVASVDRPPYQVRSIEAHAKGVICADFSPLAREALTGSMDGTLRLWDLAKGREIRALKGHTDWVNCAQISPNGRLAASGSRDQSVRIWRLDRESPPTVLSGHESAVSAVAFSPDGNQLVSGDYNGTVRLWSLNSNEKKVSTQIKGQVMALSFTDQGPQVVHFNVKEGTLTCFNISTSNELFSLEPVGVVSSACFSRDGKMVVYGTAAGSVHVWDLDAEEEKNRFGGHVGWVRSVAISSDGQLVASGGYDHTIRIHRIGTFTSLTFNGHSESVDGLSFATDGKYLVSVSADRKLCLWRVPPIEEE